LALDLGRYDEAYVWLNRALEVNPREPFALSNLGYNSRLLKRFEEAAMWLGRAEALGGSGATFTNLYWVQLDLAQGNVAEARRRAEAYAAGHPGDPIAVGALAYAATAARDPEAVEALTGHILAQAPDWGLGAIPAETRIARAWALRELGRRDEAAPLLAEAGAWLEEALSRCGPQPDLLHQMAARSAVAGEAEDALRWLQQAADAGYADVGMLRWSPMFDALASDARFTALLGRMEADVAAMRGRLERGEVDLGMGPGT
jgi:tetratricopeptide (TPR) repeat protein